MHVLYLHTLTEKRIRLVLRGQTLRVRMLPGARLALGRRLISGTCCLKQPSQSQQQLLLIQSKHTSNYNNKKKTLLYFKTSSMNSPVLSLQRCHQILFIQNSNSQCNNQHDNQHIKHNTKGDSTETPPLSPAPILSGSHLVASSPGGVDLPGRENSQLYPSSSISHNLEY